MLRAGIREGRLGHCVDFGNRRWISSSKSPSKTNAKKRLSSKGRTPGFARKAKEPSSPHQPLRHLPAQQLPTSPSGPLSLQRKVQNAIEQNSSNLLAPVCIPADPHSVLSADHPSGSILENSAIVVHRQLEMMNVIIGFEQANRYVINDPHGNTIGYLAERDHGFGSVVARQALRTHRSFTTHVFDAIGVEVLRFHRPFSWISSRIRVYDATTGTDMSHNGPAEAQVSSSATEDMRVIGEAHQQWAPLRRKYNLFLHRDLSGNGANTSNTQLTSGDLLLSKSTSLEPSNPAKAQLGFAQFAYVNEPLLSWDFSLKAADDRLIGSVNRNFSGFGRELFTDTGVYALRMDATGAQAGLAEAVPGSDPVSGMTRDQRAIMLATAVSIDFDYFSRDRGGVMGGGFFPVWFPMGGGGGAAAEGPGAEAGAGAGAMEEATATGAGRAGAGTGTMIENGITGAGTMAGYEAMQRGREIDSQSPQSQWGQENSPPPTEVGYSPWDEGFRDDGRPGQPPSGVDVRESGTEEGGGGDGSWLDDFF